MVVKSLYLAREREREMALTNKQQAELYVRAGHRPTSLSININQSIQVACLHTNHD